MTAGNPYSPPEIDTPIVNLIVMAVLSSATTRLRAAGYRVGLLGASR